MTRPRDDAISNAELERYVGGVDFPANKTAIVGQAQREGAPPEVLDYIRNAPNRTYQNITDLSAGATLG